MSLGLLQVCGGGGGGGVCICVCGGVCRGVCERGAVCLCVCVLAKKWDLKL